MDKKKICVKFAETMAKIKGLTYLEAVKMFPRAYQANTVYTNNGQAVLEAHCVHCARAEALSNLVYPTYEIGQKLRSKVTGEIVTVTEKPANLILGMGNANGVTIYSDKEGKYFFLQEQHYNKWEAV